ncbi:hypothetical protein GALL_378840 [mine drainage metagenome]|uniref:Uncharacterized protein n=1 Tax=mine drainage metagenome TaxID=410659 RepID=A0A1J5QWT9_9ZZZZ
MRVQSDQLELGPPEDRQQPLHRLTARDREAELLVLVSRRDELVAARVHAGGHAHHHRDPPPVSTPGLGEPVDLRQRVQHESTDACLDRAVDLGVRLVVAVQPDVGTRNPGAQRRRQLPARARVDAQPLLVRPACDCRAQERLAGVVHVDLDAERRERGREGVAVGPSPDPEVVLVHHEGGRAVLGGKPQDVDPGDLEHAVRRPPDVARPEVRQVDDLAGSTRTVRGHGAHIRSGAPTPSSPSPFTRT